MFCDNFAYQRYGKNVTILEKWGDMETKAV